jgi:hypothetical protein
MRYSLIGDRLLGVSSETVQVEAPQTSPSSFSPTNAEPPTPGVFAGDEPSTTAPDVPETVQVKDLAVRWTKQGALGLPAVVADQLLMPVSGGLSVFVAANGNPGIVPTTLPVDRGDYQGRVDAAAVGSMVIETRGGDVVGLAGSSS